MVVAISSRN